jgi:hypothetical protein
MKPSTLTLLTTALLFAILIHPTPHALADNDNDSTQSSSASSQDTRYGPFNLFDHRSAYGQDIFPEPFLVDDSDLEDNEARLDWLYTKAGSSHTNLVTAEVEKGFGLVTLELEVPYEWDSSPGALTHGFDNIDFGIRAPFFQYVSKDGFIDTTFGVGLEAGIPTNSPVSKNAELVPKVFNDLRLGKHVTLQSMFGYSQLYGTGDEGGIETFEYGFVIGYTIDRQQLPLPHVQQLIPMFELNGGTQLNKDNPGNNSLLGNAAIRVNLDSIGQVQPRLGFGFVFPCTSSARQDVHWGLYTSLVFEY